MGGERENSPGQQTRKDKLGQPGHGKARKGGGNDRESSTGNRNATLDKGSGSQGTPPAMTNTKRLPQEDETLA